MGVNQHPVVQVRARTHVCGGQGSRTFVGQQTSRVRECRQLYRWMDMQKWNVASHPDQIIGNYILCNAKSSWLFVSFKHTQFP